MVVPSNAEDHYFSPSLRESAPGSASADFPIIELRHWRVFHAVHDYGGYQASSSHLHLTQPTVCHTVSRLEDSIGIPLFATTGHKVRVTEAGQALIRRSRNLLSAAVALERYARHLRSTDDDAIYLLIENTFPDNACMRVLEQFRMCHPNVRVIADHVGVRCLSAALKDHAYTLSISSVVPAGFTGTPLTTIEYVPVVHMSHPLMRQEAVPLSDLKQYPEVVISENVQSALAWCPPVRIHLREIVNVPTIEAAMHALQVNGPYAWLPRSFLYENSTAQTIRALRLSHPAIQRRQFYLIRRQLDKRHPVLANLELALHRTLSSFTNGG